ncbi:uncharacterized protein [Rutidosis leptorrhynchoides]|uniref:uncharacterized protein n=1 Tax=Rutidosis leptorrhynchoides TaxID=125765 RepID=UPI003A9A2A9D
MRNTSVQDRLAGEQYLWDWNRELTGRTRDELESLVQIVASVHWMQIEKIDGAGASLRMKVFVWRALKERIPVRIELDERGIDLDSVRCPLCDDDVETVIHSLALCKCEHDIWSRVFKWWNLENFSSQGISELSMVDNGSQCSTQGNLIWQAARWICSYLIWSTRNNLVFQRKQWNATCALNEIQIKSFEWISRRLKDTKLDWHIWLTNPSFYFTNS